MRKSFDVSMVREVLIRHRPGSDAPLGRSYSRFLKRVERLFRAPILGFGGKVNADVRVFETGRVNMQD